MPKELTKRAFVTILLVLQMYAASTQVLPRDSLALVDFYNKTNGSSWLDNSGWLQRPVAFWRGVQLDPGGQVIALRLPTNNLSGLIPPTIKDMVSLHVLDLSGNELREVSDALTEMEITSLELDHNLLESLPDFSDRQGGFSLVVNNNKLTFGDLEPNSGLAGLVYTPQDSLGQNLELQIDLGNELELNCSTPGAFNQYQWFLNGDLIPAETSPTLQITSATFDDVGVYQCEVTNDLLSDLTIVSRPQKVRALARLEANIANISGELTPVELEFYRKNAASTVFESSRVIQGSINDDVYMGQYLIKARPFTEDYAPIYLGTQELQWDKTEFLRIDGNQGSFDQQLPAIQVSSGNSNLTIDVEAPGIDFSHADAYLFQKVNGNEILRGHGQPDDKGQLMFSSLEGGEYEVVIDIPGVSKSDNEIILTVDNEDLEITVNVTSDGSQSVLNHSIARKWSEVLLDAIRNDFARPTVHARNLFHVSAAMYDAWAIFDTNAKTYLLGNTINEFSCPIEQFPKPDAVEDINAAREEAISFAAAKLLNVRFGESPGSETALLSFDEILVQSGYELSNISTDYTNGDAAALGNYIAQCYIDYGLQDGSNEQNGYANKRYKPVNGPLVPAFPGNPNLNDPNRWQPLTLDVFIDQAGNTIPRNTPEFLSPEWGIVSPFALTREHLDIRYRDDFEYWLYHDPGAPPTIDLQGKGPLEDEYKWGFSLVSIWSAHLDPADGVMWDISPANIGNSAPFPTSFTDYEQYYNYIEGGDQSRGYDVNPKTGLPYEPQIVPRADYGRVLAEFWADGPDSETPPGHWFTILNYVNDHPLFEKRFKGDGDIVDELEWDVKAYFALGGAMHDAAISAWGIKGFYDYIRPVSAIRSMADRGQSTDPDLPSYHEDGIPLVPGYIELVEVGDPLAGAGGENVGKIKLFAWRGPDFIQNPDTFIAGVDWILAENWWPYQRPSFVTPPFAGYISGHSTYSRAAAEVMTLLTGDEYFPGGLGEFHAPKNEFLVFEDGPSVDITLQWATYRDASDQTSLSRIWGGIHPPADDIPGRIIGEQIGIEAFAFAEEHFTGSVEKVDGLQEEMDQIRFFPNPVQDGSGINIVVDRPFQQLEIRLVNMQGGLVLSEERAIWRDNRTLNLEVGLLPNGLYLLEITSESWRSVHKVVVGR